MSSINYSDKIPNNVNLSEDRTLQRALEQWQPNYLSWWNDMGPDGSQNFDVYLRTAVSVDPQGWAQFGHVKMPDYRWGIFLNPAEKDRKIHFGDHKGEAAWQDVPGEHRANLRRIIVTQGDTEPASVEQQRHLGLTCPSQYDLRNLFQVNVEEGRHLWAMVYLLHKYFGRDGREEGEALLERRSGEEDNPRILQAFNEKTPDWLSFFMFTYFTDRDGKFQLCALAESSFDPLARTTKFMLTEEAHHMFVGESGVSRVIQRTCAAMNELKTDDPKKLRAAGVIDLPTLQRYLNFHFSVTIDLFGADESSNAATFYSTGLKGRYEEGKRVDDHQLRGQTYRVLNVQGDQLVEKEVPMLNALNEVLRDDYIKDSVGRCRALEQGDREGRHPVPAEDAAQGLPPQHRLAVGREGVARRPRGHATPNGTPRSTSGCPAAATAPSSASLMGRVVEPGKFANWIAPPVMGINRQPVDFDYVRFAEVFLPLPARREGRGEGECQHPLRHPRPRQFGTAHPHPTLSLAGRGKTRHGHGRRRGHQPAPDRPRDLHPLQHLRGHLPGGRDHARFTQLRGRRGQVQPVHGLRAALPHRQHRQLAADAARARLHAVEEQLGWDSLPAELSADELAAAGGSVEAAPTGPGGARRPTPAARPRSTARPGTPRCRPGRPRTPTPTCTAPRRPRRP
jgi:benzoyl-CoA 2,3-dioxygenase component B